MLITINGRRRFFHRINSVTKVKPGRFTIDASHGAYTVNGGCAAGGYHNEWYVEGPHWQGAISCKSLVEACKLVDGV